MSSVESPEFYKEANDMQPGWGKFLLRIDKLKDRVNAKKHISIKDACYILWAEQGIDSPRWLKFQKWAKQSSLHNRRFPWLIWKGLFFGWEEQNKCVSIQ
jgi:hypothetical protein